MALGPEPGQLLVAGRRAAAAGERGVALVTGGVPPGPQAALAHAQAAGDLGEAEAPLARRPDRLGDVLDLARSVRLASDSDSVRNCVLVYLNSATPDANKKYEQFVACFGGCRRLGIQSMTIRYRRYAVRRTAEAEFVNDCLILKGAR